MRYRYFSLLVLIILGVNSFITPVQAQISVELHEGLVGQIRKLNPLYADSNPVDRDITALIYEGLTSINQYGEVIPDLAEGWIVSSDGLDYIFQLRQDVLWQDGLPFTAADVAYTFRTIRSPDFTGDPTLRDFWRTIEIQVLDEYTIRFRLVQPLASFPERLRQGILPFHALEGAPVASLDQHPFNLSPIGTGAYQLENLYASNGQITGVSLRVAPNYRLRPEGQTGYAIDRIIFRTYPTLDEAKAAFSRGEINSLGVVPTQNLEDLRQTAGVALHTTVAPAMGVLIFNWHKDELAYLRDQRFRMALTLIMDRSADVLKPLGGRAVPADSPILPSSWAFNPAAVYPARNEAQARQLISLVSFEPYQPPPPEDDLSTEADESATENTPPPVEQRRNFKILVVDDGGIAGVAFEVANQWASLGMTVELDIVDFDTYFNRLQTGDFDVALVEYSFEPKADPDQFVFWHAAQYQVGQNYGGLPDNYISNVLLLARINPDNLRRKQLYDEFQIAFTARSPAIVLYNPLLVYVTTNRLQGVQLDFISVGSDRFRTIQNWSFSQ